MTLTRLTAGEKLFEAGDKADCMWAVIDGAVDLTDRDASGDVFLVDTRTAKQSIGEKTIVADERMRSLTATVTEDCVLGVISRKNYRLRIHALKVSFIIEMKILQSKMKILQSKMKILQSKMKILQ